MMRILAKPASIFPLSQVSIANCKRLQSLLPRGVGNIHPVSELIPTLDSREDAGAPDVSVVIPTLNRWDELARLGLRAVLSQRGVNVEAIVVDDGSATSAP